MITYITAFILHQLIMSSEFRQCVKPFGMWSFHTLSYCKNRFIEPSAAMHFKMHELFEAFRITLSMVFNCSGAGQCTNLPALCLITVSVIR